MTTYGRPPSSPAIGANIHLQHILTVYTKRKRQSRTVSAIAISGRVLCNSLPAHADARCHHVVGVERLETRPTSNQLLIPTNYLRSYSSR
ncbi:Protein of unknown function [Pyronema omphalodes CBS 100304]|uniref:Uncharacterized protein n=1 Tax=Pyronema omphalodes (strain CBS 100304) TaxID=1076935 RepID=U4LF95_PYROM|nr:Protein of unknown function [Pyronema omphalodes CBS 100304]